jgi:predicted tellurium resistance membrane protein TerC
MDWIINNKEWIFSGIGVFIIAFVLKIFLSRNNRTIKQIQNTGKESTNIQSAGDININNKRNDK